MGRIDRGLSLWLKAHPQPLERPRGVEGERLGSVGEYDEALRAMDVPIRPDTVSAAA